MAVKPPKLLIRSSIFAFLLIFLIPFVSAQYFCDQISDCPIPECLTSVRSCDAKACQYSPCLLSGASTPSQANDAADTDFEHYTDLVGLGGASRDESVFQEPGFFDSVRSLRYSGILIIGALALIMMVMLAKMGANGKLMIAALAIVIILGGVIQMGTTLFLKNPDTLWKLTTISDFTTSGFDAYSEDIMSGNALQSISHDLVNARVYRHISQREEKLVAILEFKNTSAVDVWNLNGGYRFSKDSVYGETVYITSLDPPESKKNRMLTMWDEDRFIFIAVGSAGISRESVVNIVKNYPYRSSKFFSRLSVDDSSKPEIYNIQPANGAATSNHRLRFWVSDDLNLDKSSVTVTGISGFDLKKCTEDQDGSLFCDFKTEYQPGDNFFSIIASDRTGNKNIHDMHVYLDNFPPYLVNITPELGEYTNSTRVIMLIADDFSVDRAGTEVVGLPGFKDGTTDCYYHNFTHVVCPFLSEAVEGANNFRIILRDSAGNSHEIDHYFVYVGSPKIEFSHPKQDQATSKNHITFKFSHEGQSPLQSIHVSHKDEFEDIISTCHINPLGFTAEYVCSTEGEFDAGPETITVSFVEADGNVYKLPLHFTYDDVAPTISDITTKKKGTSTFAYFNMTDKHSQIDIDTFSPRDLTVFTIDMDCVPVDSQAHYACHIEFFDVAPGNYPFAIVVSDVAGNEAQKEVEVVIE